MSESAPQKLDTKSNFWGAVHIKALFQTRKYNTRKTGILFLKIEMFYGFEEDFKSLDCLVQPIVEHIWYYNNKRINHNKKDIVLFYTELNPSNNIICLTFWNVVHNSDFF